MSKMAKLVLACAALASFGQVAKASTISMDIVSASTLGSMTDLGLGGLTATSSNGNNVNTGYTTSSALALNGGSLSLSSAQVVNGSSSSYYAAPWTATTNGQTTSNYLSVYNGGTATFTLTSNAHSFALDWGSVDGSNSVTINMADGSSQTFTGSQLATLASTEQVSLTTQGGTNWGANGSLYVAFSDNASTIKSVVLGSGQNSFEVSDARVSAVPLPAALPLFGSAVVGLGAFIRRRNKKAA